MPEDAAQAADWSLWIEPLDEDSWPHRELRLGFVYVDTSALGALLIDRPESRAVVDWLDQTSAALVSSDLLETQLRRLAVREDLDQSDVTRILDGVALAALDRAVYRSAGLLPMTYLHTLVALHVEAAIRLDASAILTYDSRLGEAARSAGLDVISPRAASTP